MKTTVRLLLLVVLLIAACSGGQPAATALPTPTQIPTYAYVSPTPVALVATALATEAVQSGASAQTIALGQGRYTALGCDQCHGANGEGVAGKGPKLAGTSLSLADFMTFLRSGGSVGTSHQYASNRLSDTGGVNLYAYVKSLAS